MSLGSSGEKAPNIDDLMRLGVRSAKTGNRENARVIFRQVLENDKRNVAAWLWMAALAEDPIDRRRYLETVLTLDPENATAKKQLAAMDQAVSRSEGVSIRLGIMILAVLILAVALVGACVLIITTTSRIR